MSLLIHCETKKSAHSFLHCPGVCRHEQNKSRNWVCKFLISVLRKIKMHLLLSKKQRSKQCMRLYCGFALCYSRLSSTILLNEHNLTEFKEQRSWHRYSRVWTLLLKFYRFYNSIIHCRERRKVTVTRGATMMTMLTAGYWTPLGWEIRYLCIRLGLVEFGSQGQRILALCVASAHHWALFAVCVVGGCCHLRLQQLQVACLVWNKSPILNLNTKWFHLQNVFFRK